MEGALYFIDKYSIFYDYNNLNHPAREVRIN